MGDHRDCWTQCYPCRCAVHCVDFLCSVDQQIPAEKERIYAIMDNLEMHHCRDLLLFMLHHERWEFVSQPTYAAYLNLIEPWWKVLRSLALKGRRFETWQQIIEAVEAATASWNAHKHPFVWGDVVAINHLVVLRSSPSASKLCAFSECTPK
jgi:transposase